MNEKRKTWWAALDSADQVIAVGTSPARSRFDPRVIGFSAGGWQDWLVSGCRCCETYEIPHYEQHIDDVLHGSIRRMRSEDVPRSSYAWARKEID